MLGISFLVVIALIPIIFPVSVNFARGWLASTADEKGIYFSYTPAPLGASPYRLSTETQCLDTIVNLPFPGIACMSLNGR